MDILLPYSSKLIVELLCNMTCAKGKLYYGMARERERERERERGKERAREKASHA